MWSFCDLASCIMCRLVQAGQKNLLPPHQLEQSGLTSGRRLQRHRQGTSLQVPASARQLAAWPWVHAPALRSQVGPVAAP